MIDLYVSRTETRDKITAITITKLIKLSVYLYVKTQNKYVLKYHNAGDNQYFEPYFQP